MGCDRFLEENLGHGPKMIENHWTTQIQLELNFNTILSKCHPNTKPFTQQSKRKINFLIWSYIYFHYLLISHSFIIMRVIM